MRRYRPQRRIPIRLIAAAVGAVLVAGNGLLVLAPVLGLVGAAGSLGPVLQLPVGGMVLAVVVGFLVAIVCVVVAGMARYAWLAWTLVVAAWIASLIASVWPLVATATAAVDRVGEIIPWIVDLIQQVT